MYTLSRATVSLFSVCVWNPTNSEAEYERVYAVCMCVYICQAGQTPLRCCRLVYSTPPSQLLHVTCNFCDSLHSWSRRARLGFADLDWRALCSRVTIIVGRSRQSFAAPPPPSSGLSSCGAVAYITLKVPDMRWANIQGWCQVDLYLDSWIFFAICQFFALLMHFYFNTRIFAL